MVVLVLNSVFDFILSDPDDDFQPDNIRVVGEQFEKDTQTDLSLLTSPPIESNSSSLQADNVLAVEEQVSTKRYPIAEIFDKY